MLFSSITFLYYFLPCVLILYFAVPKKLKNPVLLVSSIFFYAWGEPKYVILMVISILQGYISGILIEKSHNCRRSKFYLTASVILSLALLGYFKYADFFIGSFNRVTGLSLPLLKVALPIGISFYTFQILSYTIDVYRGDVPSQKNIINLAAYISMFPQLIAGPIVRYSDIAKQLESRSHSVEAAAGGISLFITGLSKKVLIANILGEFISAFNASGEKSLSFYWGYALACTLQIYFDFSGYSDMAIGLGRIFGFHFPKNFNYPYISGSITEFWRRWHISLGSWFRDYLYIPLGGNRVSRLRRMLNIFIVWMATGLWHGAAWNFVLWGIIFAVLLIAEKLWLLPLLKKLKFLNHLYVMFCIIISFVIFDASGIPEAFSHIASMFGAGHLPIFTAESIYYLKSYALVFVIAIIGATPAVSKLAEKCRKNRYADIILNIAEPLVLIILLSVCTAFLIDGSFNPFLYFRF